MRKLMWFVVGFTAAMAIAAYLLQLKGFLLLGVFFSVCGLVLYLFKSNTARLARLLLFGCAAAMFWTWSFHSLYLSDIRELDGEINNLSVEIDQFSKETDYGISVDGTVKINGKPYKIRVYSYDLKALEPGDRLEGTFRLSPRVGKSSADMYYSGSGIYLVGYMQEGEVIRDGQLSLRQRPAHWRQYILELLSNMLPEDTVAFAQALLLGEKSGLDYQTKTDLSVSGIRHVVAVSGLHVSIICSMVIGIFGRRRVLTPVVGIAVLVLFAAITGFTPSVVRSCVMYALMFGSLAAMKDYDAPTALSFAVLVMLLVNPMAITSVSLQLSVACVVGILLFSGRIRGFILSEKCLGIASAKTKLGKIKRWFADSVSVTLSTMVTTMPLCAAYFGTISILGIVTNLLTLWVITFLFCGLLIAIIAGAVFLPVGQSICWVLSWLIRYVLWVAGAVSSIPFAAVYTVSPYVILWLVFVYVLLVLLFAEKNKHPWLTLGAISVGLVCTMCLSWLEPKTDDYRFTVMDVGQGQCLLLQYNNQNYIVDCGGDDNAAAADVAAQTLLSQGITRLEGVIVTHYDTDHCGGVANLLTRVPAEKLYLPNYSQNTDITEPLEKEYSDRICWIEEDTVTTLADIGITIYSGSDDLSDNESSLCVLFQPEDCDILITSDRGSKGEKSLLEQNDLPLVDVLVVGHHGAKDSTGYLLLYAVKPLTAVISVGEGNHYGHPSQEVLERLSMFACNILRTDRDGTIVIRG